jgi:2-amino-4-hydroxy-6-hydroxymethyldihydropteridine diphosphokinase
LPENGSTRATLGLGGNIGEPIAAMASALRSLDRRGDCRVVAVSRLYKTPPWGKTDQSFFYNCCASVDTVLDPDRLLVVCLGIEREMKRVRVERWGPRTIDIDILTYGDVKRAAPSLELPHPRMTERGFVLKPLSDIEPSITVAGRTVAQWLLDADIGGIEVADDSRDWWRDA